MIDLNAKNHFRLLTPDHYKDFADLIAHPAMRLAMNAALNQLIQSPVTTEELNGAKKYMNILASLSTLETPQRLPQKSLKGN